MSADTSIPSPEEKARYEAAKKELVQAIGKKRLIDRQLAALETQIYKLEGSYLTDTAAHNGGNIIHGFENYLKTQANKKKYELTDADRLFSTSSLSYLKSMDLQGEGEESEPQGDEYKQSNGAITTVVLQPAPRPPDLTPAQAKKARDREYQRKKRANRRSVGTPGGSDDESVTTTTTTRRPNKRARMMTEEE